MSGTPPNEACGHTGTTVHHGWGLGLGLRSLLSGLHEQGLVLSIVH